MTLTARLFLLLLIVGGLFFGLTHLAPVKNYRSPVGPNGPLALQVAASTFITDLKSSVASSVLPKGGGDRSVFVRSLEIIKNFLSDLMEWLLYLPGRIKNNWEDFLFGHPKEQVIAIPPTNASTTTIYNNAATPDTPKKSSAVAPQVVAPPAPDLNVAVSLAASTTPDALKKRLSGQFSDPVEVILDSENEGQVVPQFKNGRGKTYIFLINENKVASSTNRQ